MIPKTILDRNLYLAYWGHPQQIRPCNNLVYEGQELHTPKE